MGLALLSLVLIGSLTNPVIPLSPLGMKCVKLGVEFLHQEGREVANFPWGGCGGQGRESVGLGVLKVSGIQRKGEEKKRVNV